MKRLILHIGTPKTGTTSIQQYLASMPPAIPSGNILYPQEGRPNTGGGDSWGHHLLTWSIRNKRSFSGDEHWRKVATEIDNSPADVVVISAEGFCRFDDKDVAKIEPYLRLYDVSIVIYLRNPLGYLTSAFKQRVKTGNYHGTFQSFIRKNVHLCNYSRIVECWSTVFGLDRIIVRSYDAVKQDPGLLADFMYLLFNNENCSPEYFINAQEANVSPSDETIHLIRFINVIEQRLGGRNDIRGYAHRLRRAVLHRTSIGRTVSTLTRPFFSAPLVKESDLVWLRSQLLENNSDLILSKLGDADHHRLAV